MSARPPKPPPIPTEFDYDPNRSLPLEELDSVWIFDHDTFRWYHVFSSIRVPYASAFPVLRFRGIREILRSGGTLQ